jgi:hypothetical protein
MNTTCKTTKLSLFASLLVGVVSIEAAPLPNNGVRTPLTVTLTATSEYESEPVEWSKNGTSYKKYTIKLDVFKIGNKQVLEILKEEGLIPDNEIKGWALVDYLQTSGSSADEDTAYQQGSFLVKTGQDPVDLNEIGWVTLTNREVESGSETTSETSNTYSEAGKFTGQCIGKIYYGENMIGSGLAQYTNTWTWSETWSDESYEYVWSEVPQSFSITGISGWLSGEARDDDPNGNDGDEITEYYPSNPQADYTSHAVYDEYLDYGPILYFYDSDNDISYYGVPAFAGTYYSDQDDEIYYSADPSSDFESVSLVSTNGSPDVYRYVFYDSTNNVNYYSLVEFDDLYYFTYNDDEEEDSVLIQGSIKMSGKGTPIRLPEWSY